MATLTSKLIVELIDRASGPSARIAATMKKLRAASRANAVRMGEMRGALIGAGGAAFALYRGLSSPLKAATEFESKLEDIGQKINAPISTLPKLGAELRAIARQTTQTASEIAEGMDILAGKGAKREDALAMLPAIGRAATAYRAEVKDLAEAGFSALDNLKIPANQFAKALDVMSQAGKAGAFELKDMAREFPALTASAHALKIDGVDGVAKLSAALQIARKGAGNSAEAATNVNNLMQKIVSPETTKKFKKVGIDIRGELKQVQKNGKDVFLWIANAVQRATKGDPSKLGDFFQDAQVQQFMRPLLDNIQEYRKIRDEAMKAQGVVDEDYQRRLKTGAIAIKRFKIGLENISLAIGTALLPGLTKLADVLVPISNRFADFAERHPALTRAVVATTTGLIGLRIAGVAAAFGLRWMWGGALATAAGSLRLVAGAIRLVTSATKLLRLALISTGVGAALVLLGTAAAFISNNLSGLGTFIDSFGESLKRNLGPGAAQSVDWLLSKFREVSSIFDRITGKIDDSVWQRWGESAGQAIGIVISQLTSANWEGVGAAIGSAIWNGIKSKIGNLFSLIGSVKLPSFSSVINGMKNGPAGAPAPAISGARAAGGPVRSGSTYLVGERGPELFRASASGNISNTLDTVRSIKANALAGAGGGVTNVGGVSINVQAAPGQSPEAIAAAVERRMSEKLNALSRGAFSDGVY